MAEVKKDVSYLKDDLIEMKTDIKSVLNNHLPQIWKKIDCLDKFYLSH